jgi:hypothetical protein
MTRPAPDESDEARWSCWPEIEVEDLRAENAQLRREVRILFAVLRAGTKYRNWERSRPALYRMFDQAFPCEPAPKVDRLARLIEWRA